MTTKGRYAVTAMLDLALQYGQAPTPLANIAERQDLTDEWKKRGVLTQEEYAILTAEISKASFGMTPSEYKKHKGLTKQN